MKQGQEKDTEQKASRSADIRSKSSASGSQQIPLRFQSSDSSIVLLGVPETNDGLSLARRIVRNIFPSFNGMFNRLGKGWIRPRPIRIDLRSPEDVSKALKAFRGMGVDKKICMRKFFSIQEQAERRMTEKRRNDDHERDSDSKGRYDRSEDNYRLGRKSDERNKSVSRSRSKSHYSSRDKISRK
jgi:hypothetical protein